MRHNICLAASGFIAFFSFNVFAITVDGGLARNLQLENQFQQVIRSPHPDIDVNTNSIDGLLTALYRIDAYVDDFEADLDRLGERAAKEPGFAAEPLQTDSYQKIAEMNQVADELKAQVVYQYSRLKETAVDLRVTQAEREKAAAAIEEIENYLASMGPADRLQLVDLIQNLHGEERIDEVALQLDTQRVADVTRRKAKAAIKKSTPALDREQQIQQKKTVPQSRAKKEFMPSAGPNGNVMGTEFADGVWALTFDDGPHPEYSDKLMDALEHHHDKLNPKGAPASFFWLAQNVQTNLGVVKRAVDGGFSTNCHSWTHANLAHLGHEGRVHEVHDAVEYERSVYGRDFKFYRCPYGSCIGPAIPEVRSMIAELGLIHAFWSVDSLDWKLRDAQRTFDLVTKQMTVAKHGIVLMHDIHPYSLEAARRVLDWIGVQNDSGSGNIHLYTLDDAIAL